MKEEWSESASYREARELRFENRIRGYFNQLESQIQNGLTADVREAFPFYAHEMDDLLRSLRDFLNYAYIDHKGDEAKQFDYMEYFANRMVEVEKLLENPTPGPMFKFNEVITTQALRGLRSNLLQRFEVFFPTDDDLAPPLVAAR